MSNPFEEGGIPDTTGRPRTVLQSGSTRVAIVRGPGRSVSWIIQHPSLYAPGVPNEVELLNYVGRTIRPLLGGSVTEVGGNRVLVVRDNGTPSSSPIHMIRVNGDAVTLPSNLDITGSIQRHVSGAGAGRPSGPPFETTRDQLRGGSGQSLDVLNEGGVRVALTRGIHDAGTVSWVIGHPSFSPGEERDVRLLNARGGVIRTLGGEVGENGILTLQDNGVPNASVRAIEIGGHRIELPQSGTTRDGQTRRVFDFVQESTQGNSQRAGIPRAGRQPQPPSNSALIPLF